MLRQRRSRSRFLALETIAKDPLRLERGESSRERQEHSGSVYRGGETIIKILESISFVNFNF